MSSELAKAVMPKKPTKKKAVDKSTPTVKLKKPSKPKGELAASSSTGNSELDKQLNQLSLSQIDILKMINDYNTRLAAVEVENQKLFHILAMLTKNQDEFKGILDMLGRGMKQLKRQLDEGEEWDDEPNEPIKKDPPLHDDVTATCEVCDKVYNRRLGKCPRCGFSGEENNKR